MRKPLVNQLSMVLKRKKLKIAIFHLAFVYSGGGERLVMHQRDLLKKSGHLVDIFAPVVNKKECFGDLINQYKIRTFIPFFSFNNHESFGIIISCILAPIIALKFCKYDVILAANQPSLWIAWWVKLWFKKPYISYLAQPTRFIYPRKIDCETGLKFIKTEKESLSTRLMSMFKKFIFWADKMSVQKSDIILTNGEFARERMKRIYGVKKVVSCPAGAEVIDRVVPLTQKLKNPYLLITNRHYSQKRFEYGIVAFYGIKKKYPKLKLLITGAKTDYTQELERLVYRLKLEKEVKFLGYVSDYQIKNLYANCLIYLYTAPEEDFGMGVIEAMGRGTPVIAWNNAGPAKTVENGKTGYLADFNNAADFEAKVKKLILSPLKLKKFSQQARSHVLEKYSWDRHIRTLEEAIYSLPSISE